MGLISYSQKLCFTHGRSFSLIYPMNEFLYKIQDYVDGIKNLKAATLVCRLFQNIFLSAYLAKCGFHPRGAIVNINDSYGFGLLSLYEIAITDATHSHFLPGCEHRYRSLASGFQIGLPSRRDFPFHIPLLFTL